MTLISSLCLLFYLRAASCFIHKTNNQKDLITNMKINPKLLIVRPSRENVWWCVWVLCSELTALWALVRLYSCSCFWSSSSCCSAFCRDSLRCQYFRWAVETPWFAWNFNSFSCKHTHTHTPQCVKPELACPHPGLKWTLCTCCGWRCGTVS